MRRLIPGARTLVLAAPYTWLTLFFAVPFLIVLKISFADLVVATPPYTPLWEFVDQKYLQVRLNFANYGYLLDDSLYLSAYLSAVRTAFVSTVICLLIGYPMAYAIARSASGTRSVLLMLVIMPFWTSFLIRVYAIIGILKENGVISNLLEWTGLASGPTSILYTQSAIYVGIVYAYLPFMILPLYTNLEKLDGTLLEASADLGARPWRTFVSVTLPLSMRGIIAGSLLVFIPATGEYVIPALLGGPDSLMIGKVLSGEFFENRDWPVASAVAIVLLLTLILPIVWFQNLQGRSERAA